jgi:ubiquinone/menaquinone biosynthesis C-methylase UbiE
MSTSGTFDAAASTFESYRSLPPGVPEAIRTVIWDALDLASPVRVLEIGAGTGRIGKAFVGAGDFYVGVDTSLTMLRHFPANSKDCILIHADGRQLPFCDDVFDLVLLMQVLSGTADWQGILNETRRVLLPGGSVVVGHTVRPESGVDAQLKRQLKAILEGMNVVRHRSHESRKEALAWLRSSAVRYMHSEAASWQVNASAQDFLVRHRTGARFAALPAAVQEQALKQLADWAEMTFGSLDAGFQEKRSFELDIFQLAEGAGRNSIRPSDEKHYRR